MEEGLIKKYLNLLWTPWINFVLSLYYTKHIFVNIQIKQLKTTFLNIIISYI